MHDYYLASYGIEHACTHEGDIIDGDATRRCLYSGEWSSEPKCIAKRSYTILKGVLHVLPIAIVGVLIIIGGLFYFHLERKALSEKTSTRQKENDAFVICAMSDARYVKYNIVPALEDNHDPPFKLHTDQRDFGVGVTVIENIVHAIRNSNSAIMIMSPAFLDSEFCREEFNHCYRENLEDPAFKLFVIMMQPEHTLKTTRYTNIMTRYLDFYGCKLDRNDPRLFRKISKYLTKVKQPVIKSRTRLIKESICNSIVCGQLYKRRCAISEESISLNSTSSNGGENTQNLDEVSLNVDIHAENRCDNKLSEESVSLISTSNDGAENIQIFDELTVDVHAENRRDYELLEKECEQFDRYYEKLQNESDISESEMNEGPIKLNISDETPTVEVEGYSVFEGENNEIKMSRMVSDDSKMNNEQTTITFIPPRSMDAIDQIADTFSGDSAEECLVSKTYPQMEVLDEPLSVESKIQPHSKERIRPTLSWINHHDNEEQPTRTEHEINNLMELGSFEPLNPEIDEMGMQEEKQTNDSAKENTQLEILKHPSIIDVSTENVTQDTTKQNPHGKTVDAFDKQKQNYQHTFFEYQRDVTREEEDDSASFMVKEDRELKQLRNDMIRSRPYDAFMSFHHSGPHRDFVFDNILPELEENHNLRFQLYIHDRDFELWSKYNPDYRNCNSQ